LKHYRPIQSSIKLLAASGDPDAFLANLTEFSSSDKARRGWLPMLETIREVHSIEEIPITSCQLP